MHYRDTLINLASHGTEEAEPHQSELKNLATKYTKGRKVGKWEASHEEHEVEINGIFLGMHQQC
jgi:hypothetical protein